MGPPPLPAMLVVDDFHFTSLTSGASHKTVANYGEARRALYEDTIIPTQRCVAEELTDQLLPDFDAPEGACARWVYRGVRCLQEDENDKGERGGG